MTRVKWWLAGALILALMAPFAPPTRADAPTDRAPGRFIVDLHDGLDPLLEAGRIAEALDGRVAHVYDEVIGGFAFHGPEAAYDALRRHPLVDNVTRDVEVTKSFEKLPTGIRRIRARDGQRTAAHDLGFAGKGIRIGILDTGIDLDHPDLRVAPKFGRDCMGGGLNDREGHGTHIAGTAAALANGRGVVGVAPDAVVVPVKVLDDRGRGTMSSIICGVNHLTRLKNDGDPSNDVLVANMSLNGRDDPGHCSDGSLRQAICQSVAAGVLYTASAGNSDGAVVNEFPGNYPEVVTVTALTDFDGRGGGAAGCFALFGRTECDDTLWTRNNAGSRIDVTAPGILVESTAVGGGSEVRSGTSQAAPHAAGVAALIRSADRSLTPKRVRNHMLATGECPDGSQNRRAASCLGQGRWGNDEDSSVEPLVNALWAVQPFASPSDAAPSVSWTNPTDGEEVSGTVPIEIDASDASDDAGTLDVTWRVDGGSWRSTSYDSTSGLYEASWDSTTVSEGVSELTARATDSAGGSRTATIAVEVANDVSTLFVESFEGSRGTWSTTGLWTLVDDSPCANPGYSSFSRAFYFRSDGSCDYQTGGRVGGNLVSEEISGLGSSARVTFSHRRRVEASRPNKDVTTVAVSYDGGPWETLWRRDSSAPGCGCWRTTSVELVPDGASSVRVRFRFDSMDAIANRSRGWFVDDVLVENA